MQVIYTKRHRKIDTYAFGGKWKNVQIMQIPETFVCFLILKSVVRVQRQGNRTISERGSEIFVNKSEEEDKYGFLVKNGDLDDGRNYFVCSSHGVQQTITVDVERTGKFEWMICRSVHVKFGPITTFRLKSENPSKNTRENKFHSFQCKDFDKKSQNHKND